MGAIPPKKVAPRGSATGAQNSSSMVLSRSILPRNAPVQQSRLIFMERRKYADQLLVCREIGQILELSMICSFTGSYEREKTVQSPVNNLGCRFVLKLKG